MRGWIAVNLFLLAMILVAAGLLYLSLATVRTLGLPADAERIVMGFIAIGTCIAAGVFGKELLASIERRNRAR